MLKQIAKSSQVVSIENNLNENYQDISKLLNIDSGVLKLYNQWYKIKNDWYYFKKITNIRTLLNELIGPYLARHFNLETIDYNLAILNTFDNDKIILHEGIISKNFRKSDSEYFNVANIKNYSALPRDIADDYNIDLLKKMCNNEKEFRQLYLKLLKLSILDFYSHQIDRTKTNITFEKKESITLAPLYDYSESFDNSKLADYFMTDNLLYDYNERYIYKNCLLRIVFPSEKLSVLFNQYPEMYEDFKSILNFDMNKTLDLIEKKYDFEIPKYIRQKYEIFDNNKKEFVEKII